MNKIFNRQNNKKAVVEYFAFFLMLIILFISTGCLSVKTHTKGLASNAYPVEDEKYDVIGQGEAKSSSFHLLWFFPVTPTISYNEAVHNAVSKSGGDNLIDVYTWHEKQTWIVGTVNILHVKGKIIKYE